MATKDFAGLWVWQEPNLRQQLDWYRLVATNEMPAKYLIARRVPVSFSSSDDEDSLWLELERGTAEFLELWNRVRTGHQVLGKLPRRRPDLVDLAVELCGRMLRHCNFCRWNCRVDRAAANKHGACQLAAETRVSSFFHHRGEELIFRGRQGSGTIFFTSCNLRCAFCQNGDISTDKDNGQVVDARQLATMAWQLRLEGCHNINWVGGDPTIHLHTIVEAISLLDEDELRPGPGDRMRNLKVKSDFFYDWEERPRDAYHQGELNAPMLWNSNFFMSEPAMKLLHILMDVWLPDFKFGPGKCAVKLSRTPWYWETVTANLKCIDDWGESYAIRHLVMPNHVECCTFAVLDWVKENIPEAPVNIMDQYHPDTFCDPRSPDYNEKYVDLSRRLTSDEILAAYRYADKLGIQYKPVTHERAGLV